MTSRSRIVYLTRREHFSACHRLYSTKLSDDINQELYSKCANPNGHGHNYYVEVTLRGPVHPISGMVMNINDLKEVMSQVINKLDHKCIDKDVPYFYNNEIVSTSENIAIFIWDQIKEQLEKINCDSNNELNGPITSDILYEIKLWETEKNIVVYRGE